MKIRSLPATPVRIPCTAPGRYSHGATGALTRTVIGLTTGDSAVGLGACADGDRSADVMAATLRVIGQDIRAVCLLQNALIPAMRHAPWTKVLAARRVLAGKVEACACCQSVHRALVRR